MKPRKKIQTFKDEDAEREFWAREDSTEYIDWSQAQPLMLTNLRINQERTEKSAKRVSAPRKRAR